MASKLKDVWSECTSDLPQDVAELWWRDMLSHYARTYNNIALLEKKIVDFLLVKPSLQHPHAVALATFFNNYEYDPKAADCCAKNLSAFERFAEETGVSNETPLHQQVVSLLQAAATHSTDEHKIDGVFGSEDRHYFLDIDMSPLGYTPEEYETYSAEVQQAFSTLPADAYRSLRLRVLQNFLKIPNIFATEEFRSMYEKQARINITKEVENLKSQLS